MALLSDVIGRGTLAARPAAGTAGRLYYATDTPALYRDNGASWDTLTLASSGLTVEELDGSPTVAGATKLVLPNGSLSVAGTVATFAGGNPAGLTGATAATRYVGGTASAAPTTGTFAVGDFVIAQNGGVYICTTAGTPGTWTAASGGGGGTSCLQYVGKVTAAGGETSLTIPMPTGTYRDIILNHEVRALTAGAGNDTLGYRFNGDTAANYSTIVTYTPNASQALGGASDSFTLLASCTVPQAGSAANVFGVGETRLFSPQNTTRHKNSLWRGGAAYAATAGRIDNGTATWHNTAAVTSIAAVLYTGNGFAAGSEIAVYCTRDV